MNNLRARLADALLEHERHGYRNCKCKHVLENRWDHAEHIAAVLLSLPGIAIVEVPE